MKNTLPSTLKRTAGYLFGFALLYAPFELYRRFMEGVLDLQPGFLPHAFCPRIPTAEIFTGGFFDLNSVMVCSTIAFWLLCLVFGPFFCGRLCVAGYFTEALSHIVPDKYKIEWEKYVPASHIRYGMLLAYMLLPLWYGFYPCAYCNFYFFDSLVGARLGIAARIKVDESACVKCGLCVKSCPMRAMSIKNGTVQNNTALCIKCGVCSHNCPRGVIHTGR